MVRSVALVCRGSLTGLTTSSTPCRALHVPTTVIEHAVSLYHHLSRNLHNVETILIPAVPQLQCAAL